jgi:hypothetical protein
LLLAVVAVVGCVTTTVEAGVCAVAAAVAGGGAAIAACLMSPAAASVKVQVFIFIPKYSPQTQERPHESLWGVLLMMMTTPLTDSGRGIFSRC